MLDVILLVMLVVGIPLIAIFVYCYRYISKDPDRNNSDFVIKKDDTK